MGTSRGMSTPTGGSWTPAKQEVNKQLAHHADASPASVVSAVLSAAGGLGLGIRQGRGAGGGGGGTGATQNRRVGRAVTGLGGFGAVLRDQGLTEALRRLDLEALEGRPAVEVIARVAERLAADVDGVDGEILRTALNETILEAAQLQDELGYADLEASLQEFLNEQGLAGLVELFLARLTTDLVTAAITEHVDQRTDREEDAEALVSAVEIVCRDRAREVVTRHNAAGRFNQVDWFGTAGARLGRELAEAIVISFNETLFP